MSGKASRKKTNFPQRITREGFFMPRSNNDATNHSRQQRTVLLATDHKNSVLSEIARDRNNSIAYSAYGDQCAEHEVVSSLGFNGELREAFHWYFLGNGYRVYNPRLMRFLSSDSWSPFGKGGLNGYMYCVGDPVNYSDPTGHAGWRSFFSGTFNFFLGGPDITGPSRTRAVSASAPLGLMRPEKTGELGALRTLGSVTASAPGPRGNNSPAIHNVDTPAKHHPGYVEGEARATLQTHSASRSRVTPNLQHSGSSSHTTDLDGNTWTSTGGIHGRNVTFARVRGGRDTAGNNVNDLFGSDLAPARNRRQIDRNIDRHLAVREHFEELIRAGHEDALERPARLWARNDLVLFNERNRIRHSLG